MTYRELLEQYRAGTLDASQQAQVEADLEKHDAISEFLCEEGEIPDLGALDSAAALPENDLTASIQRTIRKTLIRLGVTVGAAVLAVTLCVIFILPHAVDSFYYDPTETVGQDSEFSDLTTSRMSLDLSVWTELFLPGRYRNNVSAIPRGYGAYDITILQNVSADGRFQSYSGQLVRDKLRLYDPSFFSYPASNAFRIPDKNGSFQTSTYVVDSETGRQTPISPEEERQIAFDALRRKPTNDLLIAYLSFRKITPYEDVRSWLQNPGLEHAGAWIGIYAEDEYGRWITENTGVAFHAGGITLNWDQACYPHLAPVSDHTMDSDDVEQEDWKTTHFLSLMAYVADHPELRQLFGGAYVLKPEEAISYVEEHGLQSYGVALVATRDALLKLESCEEIAFISTVPY